MYEYTSFVYFCSAKTLSFCLLIIVLKAFILRGTSFSSISFGISRMVCWCAHTVRILYYKLLTHYRYEEVNNDSKKAYQIKRKLQSVSSVNLKQCAQCTCCAKINCQNQFQCIEKEKARALGQPGGEIKWPHKTVIVY